jgi:hypothetical protein
LNDTEKDTSKSRDTIPLNIAKTDNNFEIPYCTYINRGCQKRSHYNRMLNDKSALLAASVCY